MLVFGVGTVTAGAEAVEGGNAVTGGEVAVRGPADGHALRGGQSYLVRQRGGPSEQCRRLLGFERGTVDPTEDLGRRALHLRILGQGTDLSVDAVEFGGRRSEERRVGKEGRSGGWAEQ